MRDRCAGNSFSNSGKYREIVLTSKRARMGFLGLALEEETEGGLHARLWRILAGCKPLVCLTCQRHIMPALAVRVLDADTKA